MSGRYILEGHKAVPCDDLMKWAEWMEKADRHVAQDEIGNVRISTVFLGLDYDFTGLGPPLLFETMVFGGTYDEYADRYSTWEEAEKGHKQVCAMVSKSKSDSESNPHSRTGDDGRQAAS